MPASLELRTATPADLNHILENFSAFWDHDEPRARHHPMFVREFADCSLAVVDDGQLVAYLLGVVSSAFDDGGRPWAYVHMVAVRRPHRRRGLAKHLYTRFAELARSRGCSVMRATVAVSNTASQAFHVALGMTPTGGGEIDGIVVESDYFGPGKPRVVFEKAL